MRNPRFAVTLASVAASFMNILDSSILNVALPSIARNFHEPASAAGLAVVGYLTMLVVVMPISGWLADRFGTRRMFLIALASFTIASALCGLAQSLPELVIARVIQGIGGGALLPTAMTMLYRVYTSTERLRIARLTTIPTALGPVLGPTLGGVLVQELSWRWVFWVNLPVGIGVFVLSWFVLAEHVEDRGTRVDILGFLLSASGVGLLVYGISQGSNAGWGSLQIIGCLVAGVALCATLIAVELRSPSPLLRLALVKLRGYRQSLAIAGFCGAAFTGILFVVPLMLQLGDGYSPIQSGTSTFCEALGVVTASQIVSRVHARFGERRLQLCGIVVLTALILVFAVSGRGMNLWTVRVLMWGIGMGSGMTQLLNQAMAFDEITPANTSQASGLYNTSRRFGGAIGVAVLSTMLATSHTASGTEAGFTAAYVAAAALSALGMVVAAQALRTGTGVLVGHADRGQPRRAPVSSLSPASGITSVETAAAPTRDAAVDGRM